MKVGILTFHCAHNYGAVLQAYALQQYISQLGHTVEIIDIRPSFLGYRRNVIRQCISFKHPFESIKRLRDEMKIYKLRQQRWDGFNNFITKRLHLSERCNQVPDNFDAYIVGSDQVWNMKTTRGLYPPYFCDFGFPKQKKIYASYAASMEITEFSQQQKSLLQRKLSIFDFIGVREDKMVGLIENLIGRDVYKNLDPTLLVDTKIWESLPLYPVQSKKYVLLYKVWSDNNSRRIAQLIANKLGAEVIELVSWLDVKTNHNKYQAATPEMFVSLIKYADYVVTDSFHGTAFSIIFQKDFYCVKVNDGQNRMSDILSSLGLYDRFVDKTSNPDITGIDYNPVMQELSSMQNMSRAYIKKILNNKKDE